MGIQIGAAIATELANGASDALAAGAAVITNNQGNWIANGAPESVWGKVQQETARKACRRYASNPGQYTGRVAVKVENTCRPYLDDIGFGTGPTVGLPFEGGQCNVNGGGYIVQIRLNRAGGGTTEFTRRCRGPIAGVRCRQVNLTQGVPEINARDSTPNTNCAVNLVDRGQQWFSLQTQSSAAAPDSGATIEITSITPCPGVPDNCGDPAPEYELPGAPMVPEPPGPTRFTPAPGIEINIDVDVNPDLTFDVDFGTGPITIDPFGDDPGGTDPGGGGGDPGDPTDPGEPGGGGSTGPGGDEEGQAPEGAEIVGLLVTVTQAPGNANRFANNSMQPFRGIGYVRMGYPGRLGLDISGGTVISPQFFHAPQRGLTNWAVSANIGFNLTIVPYYRSIAP